jgi:thiamine pyrophosphokinase
MKTDSDFLILLDGELVVTDRLRLQATGRRVIAADGGMRHACTLGVEPEIWVGDFDSTSPDLHRDWHHVERIPFPPEKNETDGEIAVEEALSRGARSILLAGALGGARSDHALLHMTYACSLLARGLDIQLSSGTEEAWPLGPGSHEFDLPRLSLFSIVNFSPVSGLHIRGAQYPLKDHELAFGSSRTLSNVADGPVTVSIESGHAVLVARPYDHAEE